VISTKKALALSCIVLALAVIMVSQAADVHGQETQRVHNVNKDKDYGTIQEAIDAADIDDMIYVRSGIFYESIDISKPISLVGESKNDTVIEGSGMETLIHVRAENVTITGFTVRRNETLTPSIGIHIEYSVGIRIIDNIIDNNKYGIFLSSSSRNYISNNTILDNSYGIISASCGDNTFSDNELIHNSNGIWLSYSFNNVFSRNTISSNEIEGILVYASTENEYSENQLFNNTNGLHIISSTYNYVHENNISKNERAFFLNAASFNIVSKNEISLNNYGVVLGTCSNNSFVENQLLNNANSFRVVTSYNNIFCRNNLICTFTNVTQKPSVSQSENLWDDGVEGNYWSRSVGSDRDEDGIGDSPYVIDESNKDNHPLMAPYMSFQIISGGTSFTVGVICNSTISEFNYVRGENDRIIMLNFTVNGVGSKVFFRICIPLSLIEPPYLVVENDNASMYTRVVASNETNSWVYFTSLLTSPSNAVLLSSLQQPIWYEWWFWMVICLAAVVAGLSSVIFRYHRRIERQKKLIEKYEFELRSGFYNHVRLAKDKFEADVKKRRSKIKVFEKKYNMNIQPHDSFKEVMESVNFRRNKNGEDRN
jgi:nitrous oxidase accessory protein